MAKTKYEYREAWLQAAVGLMTPLFKDRGYKVPKVQVTCGWPSIKGLSNKNRRIGEAWPPEASSGKVGEIFISPFLSDSASSGGVLATLVHEVVHEVVGLEAGHKSPFKKCALAVGLTGKMTATEAGGELMEFIAKWSEELGDYPHFQLDLLKRPTKKQGTRMIKMECAECGYVARTTKKWLDEVGPAHCPLHGAMVVELPKEQNTDDVEEDDNED